MYNKILINNSLRRAIHFCLRCFCLVLFVFSMKDVHAEQEKRNLKQFQEYFQDILLVIYYANPHFETIDFIKQLYSPVFKNIVFYGDRTQYVDIGEADHEYEDGDHGKYRIVYTRNGHYLSRWIKDVLINYPGYAGYLFMQDDCVMQFWNFLNLDKNKIWFNSTTAWHPGYEEYPLQKFIPISQRFNGWWPQKNPASSITEPFTCITINQMTDSQHTGWFNTAAGIPQLKKVFDHLLKLGLEEERAMLSANFKENGAAWYMVDFFYFPSRFAGKFLRVCDLFDKVFCEISIPTMLGCMDYLQNWEELPHWWSCFNSGDTLKEKHDPRYYWVHPLKFSLENNRSFVSKLFHEQFYGCLEDE